MSLAKVMKRIMEGHQTLHGIPLVAEFKVGPSWGSLADLKVV